MAQNRNPIEGQQSSAQQGGGQARTGTRTGRGFAGMDAARQREIASKGGKAAHEKGTAHEFTSEEARVAGRKGGEVVSQNREHMATIGREGGQARGHRQRVAPSDYDTHPEESVRARKDEGLSGDESLSREESRMESDDENRSISEENGQGRIGGQGPR